MARVKKNIKQMSEATAKKLIEDAAVMIEPDIESKRSGKKTSDNGKISEKIEKNSGDAVKESENDSVKTADLSADKAEEKSGETEGVAETGKAAKTKRKSGAKSKKTLDKQKSTAEPVETVGESGQFSENAANVGGGKKPEIEEKPENGSAKPGNETNSEGDGEKSGIELKNGKLSLLELSKIVNTVVDSVFIERDGRIEFAAELYEVLLAYMKVGAFYPETGVLETSLDLFFIDYIDGKYEDKLRALVFDKLAQYIDNAVHKKVEARKHQIEDPLINSLTKLVDAAAVLAQKYVDDIDNVGTADIKGFIENFAKLANVTNQQSVTDAVIQMHRSGTNNGQKMTVPKKKRGSDKR